MRVNAKALALSMGIMWGGTIGFVTAWIVVAGSPGETLGKLSVIYIGYDVSWTGALIGGAYAFTDGLIGGFLLAWLYNSFLPKPAA